MSVLESDTYGFNGIVALTAVECPECGYAEINEEIAGEYQCSACLHRFAPSEATFHGPHEDPRDNGAAVHEVYPQ